MVQLSRMVLFTLFPSTASTRPSSSGSSLLLELVLPGAFEVIISLFRLGRTPLWVFFSFASYVVLGPVVLLNPTLVWSLGWLLSNSPIPTFGLFLEGAA